MSASKTKFSFRLQYTIWFMFFSISGWSFLFGHFPDYMQLLLTSLAACALAVGIPAWFKGLPGYALKDFS